MRLVFFALFISSALALCSAYTTCTACLADTTCGWCSSTGQCLAGVSQGPTSGVCANPSLYWIYAGASKVLAETLGFPVSPVHFDVYLYPNSPLQLVVSVTNPFTDSVPLDLYIIEDLSGSFADDIVTFRSLSTSLVVDVLRYQSSPRFGVGSFAEKPVLPYGLDEVTNSGNLFEWPSGWTSLSTDALAACPNRTATSGPYNWAFCHEQDLSLDYNLFTTTIARFVTHENGNWPENSIESIMFASVCDMQWRANARRVVLIATDAAYNVPDTGNVFAAPNNYNCAQEMASTKQGGNTIVPGTFENYPDPTIVGGLVRTANIFPIIAASKALPEHDDTPMWAALIQSWGVGISLELSSDSSNLIDLIRQALGNLATVMTISLCPTCDPFTQVTSYTPLKYNNVPAGAQRSFVINLLDTSTPTRISQITFQIVGYGTVTINVTNQIPCVGCDGSSNVGNVVDLCGICLGSNACVGCDGLPNSGAIVDQCGVCGGDGSSCVDCRSQANGTAVYDVCNVCGGDGTSCLDCLGQVFGTLVIDPCGVCGGNTSCRGCDGIINSTAVVDECGVCGGNNLSCVPVLPPPPPTAPKIIAGAVAGAIVGVIAIIAIIAIVALLAKRKWDKMQYMNNQQMSAVGSSPIYKETGGWNANPNAQN
jgi:hypothetical protein